MTDLPQNLCALGKLEFLDVCRNRLVCTPPHDLIRSGAVCTSSPSAPHPQLLIQRCRYLMTDLPPILCALGKLEFFDVGRNRPCLFPTFSTSRSRSLFSRDVVLIWKVLMFCTTLDDCRNRLDCAPPYTLRYTLKGDGSKQGHNRRRCTPLLRFSLSLSLCLARCGPKVSDGPDVLHHPRRLPKPPCLHPTLIIAPAPRVHPHSWHTPGVPVHLIRLQTDAPRNSEPRPDPEP